jgi:hypothetical protein
MNPKPEPIDPPATTMTMTTADALATAPTAQQLEQRVRDTLQPLFTGKSIVMRHRLVYDALHDFMAHGLHALAIEAQAPTA